jgi:hypothetical protein
MVRVAAIPGYYGGCLPCGDGNHNGLAEVVGAYGRPIGDPETLRIAERTSGDSFREFRTGLRTGTVLDMGDGDRDGLCDILTSPEWNTVQVWEATSPDSFPSHMVWDTQPHGGVTNAQFCDLDRDVMPEIVTSNDHGGGFSVYEYRGDNRYDDIHFPDYEVDGDFGVGDFDSDGLTELVAGDIDGNLRVFECTGDDQYAQVCSLEFPNETESYRMAAARHIDVDGRAGFISQRRFWGGETDSERVRIYEEPVHNQFVCVCSLDFRFPWYSGHCVAAGDVDGDSIDEIAISSGLDVRLYKCVALHTWEQVWQWDHGTIPWIRFYDINQDTRNEMIISAESTFIWEDTSGLGAAEIPKPPPWVRSIAVKPTVSRLGWPAIFTGIPDGATVEVHNLAGRLVRTLSLRTGPSWTWNLCDQSGNLVPAGTYFAVIRSRERLVSLKLCVVK